MIPIFRAEEATHAFIEERPAARETCNPWSRRESEKGFMIIIRPRTNRGRATILSIGMGPFAQKATKSAISQFPSNRFSLTHPVFS